MISDGSTDVFTTADPGVATSGETIITGVTADTTFTATATFAGGDLAMAQSAVDIRSGADPVSLEETILADGAFAYYRFEENTVSPVALLDHSGNQRDSLAISAGGVTPDQPGAVGSAWSFAAGSVELDLNLDPSTTSFSIALLAGLDDPLAGGVNSLVSQQNSSGNGRSLVQTRPDTDSYTSWFGGGRKDLGAVSQPGDWAHVVLVYDNIDQELRFYTDGVLVSTTTGVIGETTMGNFILAANKGQNAEFLTGALDEVAVFDYALDDPDGNGDFADSRIPDHYAAYLRDATPLLGFSAWPQTIPLGESTDLAWKVGDAATTIEIDNGVGDVTGSTSNGLGGTSVTPTATTAYTITVNGTETRQVTVVVNIPILITSAGFNGSDDFEVDAINLVEGTGYDLFYSFDLLAPFLPVGVQITADATGTATFVDASANPSNDPVLFYRVEAVDP